MEKKEKINVCWLLKQAALLKSSSAFQPRGLLQGLCCLHKGCKACRRQRENLKLLLIKGSISTLEGKIKRVQEDL